MVNNIIVITNVEENPELTLEEVCRICHIPAKFVYEIIEQGVVEPIDISEETLRFGQEHLRRIRTLARLHHDLDVNVAGGALIIDMIEQMDEMRAKLELFENYFRLK